MNSKENLEKIFSLGHIEKLTHLYFAIGQLQVKIGQFDLGWALLFLQTGLFRGETGQFGVESLSLSSIATGSLSIINEFSKDSNEWHKDSQDTKANVFARNIFDVILQLPVFFFNSFLDFVYFFSPVSQLLLKLDHSLLQTLDFLRCLS